MSLAEWKKEFEGKKIVIWGMGREGRSTLAFLRRLFPEMKITIAERRDADFEAIHEIDDNVEVFADDTFDFNACDMIIKSPGIVVRDGIDASKITEETDLFLKHYGRQTIGITGTKGKSTTTSLTYALLKEAKMVNLCGNIGVPCFEVIDDMEKGELACFELSCHQLEYCTHSPDIAVFLNLYEEHLDHYGTFEKYADAKANILKYQNEDDIAIIHPDLRCYVQPWNEHVYTIGEDIYADGMTLITPEHTLTIRESRLIGSHNFDNLAVAYFISTLYGVTNTQVKEAVKKFRPLSHRLEYLGEKDGIRYVNDSISTIGETCIKAIEALDHVDTVLVGGMDRGISYDVFEEYLHGREDLNIIFMYASGKRILHEMQEKHLLRDGLYEVENLEEAVAMAKKITKPGHICLLSPAASSYDHFKNFEERGEVFARLAFDKE